MSFSREDYLVVCQLPYEVTMTFGKSGAPTGAKAQFRRLGSTNCLANLPIRDIRGKEITVRLPEELACQGPGRYELILQDHCCVICDTVEIWFEADCEIVSIEGKEPMENCVDC